MTASGTDLQRLLIRAEFIQPLAGRRVGVSGQFRRVAREEAELLTARCGGTCQTSVSEKTDLLVLGEPDVSAQQVGRLINDEEETARKLIASGNELQIVTEDDFLQLICQLD